MTNPGLPLLGNSAGYSPDKCYTVYVNPVNRHVTGLVGFALPVEHIDDGNAFDFYQLDNLTEEEYTILSTSINSNESMTFLDADNRTIITRKISVDLLENTYYDATLNAIYAVDNVARLRVSCVDNTLSTADDVKEVELKNIKPEHPVALDGTDTAKLKTKIANSSNVSIKLLGEAGSMTTIRLKAKIPTVEYLWLTAYPQFISIDEASSKQIKAQNANPTNQP